MFVHGYIDFLFFLLSTHFYLPVLWRNRMADWDTMLDAMTGTVNPSVASSPLLVSSPQTGNGVAKQNATPVTRSSPNPAAPSTTIAAPSFSPELAPAVAVVQQTASEFDKVLIGIPLFLLLP